MTIVEYFEMEYVARGCDVMEDIEDAVYQMYESDDDGLFAEFIADHDIDIMSEEGSTALQYWVWDMCGE